MEKKKALILQMDSLDPISLSLSLSPFTNEFIRPQVKILIADFSLYF